MGILTELNKNNQLQHGDILHCTANSITHKIIRFVTGGKKSHTALAIKAGDINDPNSPIFIIDSQRNGVNLKTIENWEKKYNYTYQIHRKQFSSKDAQLDYNKHIQKRMLSKMGITGYYFMGLIWQVWYNLTGRWRGKTEKKAEKRMYCSEFVAWVLEIPEWWTYHPQKLFDYLNSLVDYKLIKS